MTACSDKADAVRCYRAGVDDYLPKPVHTKELFRAIEEGLKGSKTDGLYKKLSIIIAEDNRTNQEVLLGILENLGYSADIACDGRVVLYALEKKHYDLVFMDIQMPEMDGFEATGKNKGEGKNYGKTCQDYSHDCSCKKRR